MNNRATADYSTQKSGPRVAVRLASAAGIVVAFRSSSGMVAVGRNAAWSSNCFKKWGYYNNY